MRTNAGERRPVPPASWRTEEAKPRRSAGGVFSRRGPRALVKTDVLSREPARDYIAFFFFFDAFFAFIGAAVIGFASGPPRETAGPPELWPVEDCWANAGAAAKRATAEAINMTFFIMNS